MRQELNEIFGQQLGGVISSTFYLMEVAEEEIRAAQKRNPDHTAAIWEAFRFLTPSEALRARGDRLYRAHCREILERIVNGQDLRPPTKAEKLGALAEVSFRFPLNNDLTFVYTRLFVDLFGKQDFIPDWALSSEIQQSWPGRRQEIEADLDRKLQADWRK